MKGKSDTISNVLATSAAALAIQFVLQAIAGWYLNRAYIPHPDHAHDTMVAILGGTPHGIISGFHYWGSAFFIGHSFLHLCLMMFSGRFRPPNHWRWAGAVALFVCAMLFQITGNLLPFDQHGVQTAAIEGGIAAGMPGGQEVARIIMGGEPAMNANTLPTWYFAHRIIIPIALILGTIGAAIAHLRSPLGRAFYLPAAVLALLPLGMAFMLQRPLGTAATELDYNRYEASVSWYTWPLHGSLQAFSQVGNNLGWIGTAVIPTLFFVFLLIAPALSRRIANAGIQSIFVLFIGYFLVVAILFGGKFAPLTGTRDPVSPAPAQNPQNQPTSTIDQALAKRGRELFNTIGCQNCHGKDGLKASGGPSLEKVHEQYTDAQWYVDFVRDPKSKKPGSTMPGFATTREADLRAVAEFLRGPKN